MFKRAFVWSLLSLSIVLGATACANLDMAEISYSTPRDGRSG